MLALPPRQMAGWQHLRRTLVVMTHGGYCQWWPGVVAQVGGSVWLTSSYRSLHLEQFTARGLFKCTWALRLHSFADSQLT